ncbi:MAG: YbfB/YjiJ family MFS transporter [Coxiellaceae bacterium]|nr:YbfB/YjiJ family MFS transporter [Coxiellaceae bacterium]
MMFGLALCRFSYTPMIPFLINQHWLSAAQANYVGSYNFIGYFIGAVLAFTVSRYIDRSILVRVSLALTVVSLAFSGWMLGYWWLSWWRLLAGIIGAFMVILSPAFVLHFVDSNRRHIASGIVFTGAGIGIIISSLVIPSLASLGLSVMWLIFAAFAMICVLIAWSLFGREVVENAANSTDSNDHHQRSKIILYLLAFSYFVCGIGVVPHTLFLSHYLHQDMHVSLASSGLLFSLFGAGCLLGAFLGGVLSARFGVYVTLCSGYVIGIVALLMVVLFHSTVWVLVSSILIGIYLFATVNLTSLRVGEVVPMHHHPKYWGRITLCFALGQAFGGYGMSAMVASGASYIAMFWLAGVALLLGLIAILFSK